MRIIRQVGNPKASAKAHADYLATLDAIAVRLRKERDELKVAKEDGR